MMAALLSPVGLFLLLLCLVALVLLLSVNPQKRRVASRLQAMTVREVETDERLISGERFGAVGHWLAQTPLVGEAEQAKMAGRLREAGFSGRETLPYFVAAKAAATLTVLFGGWAVFNALGWVPATVTFRVIFGVVGALIGWRLPDFHIGRIIKRRRATLEDGIADALDLLVICVESGLGLEQGLDRVSRDIEGANPVIANELRITVDEMRIMSETRIALDNFAQRSGLASIKSVMTTLIQSTQYGTPLAQSLRVLAAEMRALRLLRIEERAARLPVLLTVPLIVFILPSLFILIGGPAFLQMSHMMAR